MTTYAVGIPAREAVLLLRCSRPPSPRSAHRVTLIAMSGAPSALGRRVIVTGLAGSGKSTFSLALAAKTGLPVIHLDLYFWKPGWVAPSQTEWREKQCGVLAGTAWIADGNYHETLDLRLERADTVVFLDPPWWLCAGRAFLRGFRMPGELPGGPKECVMENGTTRPPLTKADAWSSSGQQTCDTGSAAPLLTDSPPASRSLASGRATVTLTMRSAFQPA